MYLTKITNVNDTLYHAHKIVRSLYPKELNQHVLFNYQDGRIVMLSNELPKGECFDKTVDVCDSVQVEPFTNGDIVQLHVKFNPTHIVNNKRCGLYNDDAKKWINNILTSNGVDILELNTEFNGIIRENKPKDNKIVTITSYISVGTVIINDAELFNKLLITGIGSNKFLGFGFIDAFR